MDGREKDPKDHRRPRSDRESHLPVNPWTLRRRERWIMVLIGTVMILFSLWRWARHGAHP